jgi:prepilin-type N-terminal cleavage/methylation domain-containing protein/prepilin-type processing-associated H-X9-DG protein
MNCDPRRKVVRLSVHGLVRRGFSLLELVAVVAVVAVLVGLLVPAVQKARAAAAMSHCTNNLRQIGIAMQCDHNEHRRFPSGGWGWDWIGMPDRGTGPEQPGNWLYNLLPYLEQGRLRTLGAGEPAGLFEQSMARLLETPVVVFNCPSRRRGGPFPVQAAYSNYKSGIGPGGATALIVATAAARADYAANAGSQGFNEIFAGPATLKQGDHPAFAWPSTQACSGVFFQRSVVSIYDIPRGTSNVFLAGERYIDAAHYTDGIDLGDNEAIYSGFDNDGYRVTIAPPQQDEVGYKNTRIFGSAHAAGANMLYGDGSVRTTAYDVHPDVFMQSGRRFE